MAIFAPTIGLAARSRGRHAVPVPSYLDVDAVVAACTRARAGAPSRLRLPLRDAALASACAAAGLVFVGPPPEAIALIGDKVRAKEVARGGRTGDAGRDTRRGARAGYPLLVKAAAGGGGRACAAQSTTGCEAFAAARREAEAGFGDGRLLIERSCARAPPRAAAARRRPRDRAVPRRARVLASAAPPEGDRGVALAGGGRGLRERRGERRSRSRGRRATSTPVRSSSSPTATTGEHYFLEMNARLQVEHPVTEPSPASTWSSSSCGSRRGSRSARQGSAAPRRRGRGAQLRRGPGAALPPDRADPRLPRARWGAGRRRDRSWHGVDTGYDSMPPR